MDKLLTQQVIDEKVYDQKLLDDALRKLAGKCLQKNTVVNGDMLIDKKTAEVLVPKVGYTCYKEKVNLKLIL